MNTVPLWLFTGPEIGERNAALEQVRAEVSKKCPNLDTHNLYASDVSVQDVLGLLQNGSLFADGRFVVLRNAETLKKKEDIEMLVSWAASATEEDGSFLVLISDDIGIDKKIEAVVPKDKKRIFWELFENRKEQWIVAYFRKAGYEIEESAVSSILDLVENNTDALREACSRFVLFYPQGYRITEKDTDDILAHNREESPFTLFEALCDSDLEQALEIAVKLSLSKESSPVQTLAGLSFCFRRLGDWHTLREESGNRGISDEFTLKKAGFTSKRAIEQYKKAAAIWNAQDSQRVLALLSDVDLRLRSMGSAVHTIQLDWCLHSILERKGKEERVNDYALAE